MNWVVVHRVLSGLLALVGAFLGIVIATQNTGLDQQTLVWLGIISAFCPIAVSILPSIFGISGLKPEQETSVIRTAVRNVAPSHPSVARGAPLPIDRAA